MSIFTKEKEVSSEDEKLLHATNAEYTVIEEKKDLPATLESVRIYRHPLMEGKVTKDLAVLVDELEIDKKLGLTYQAKETADEILKKDIDELTSSKDYFQVTRKLIEKLFNIRKFRSMCFFENIKESTATIISTAGTGIAMVLGSLVALLPVLLLYSFLSKIPEAKINTGEITLFVVNIVASIGILVLFIAGWINMFYDKRYSFDYMKVDINYTPLKEAQVKIPRGAKLKVLEAQETKIFEDFVLVTPKFVLDHKEVYFGKIDPAILGVTKDKRHFMIVYWDIERDIERVIKDIGAFKKFKLQK